MALDPRAVEADLIAYYDGEEDRVGREMDPHRVALRESFVAALAASSRVLELGSGPGRDAHAFVDAGHRYVAVDLSFGHCQRFRDAHDAPIAQASVRHLPVRDASVDAVWTMSTLMHVPEGAIGGVLGEIRRVLVPGGVLGVAVWGGVDQERTSDKDERTGRPPRLFSRRSDERWRSMLDAVGDVEAFETFSYDASDFRYQWALVRRSAT